MRKFGVCKVPCVKKTLDGQNWKGKTNATGGSVEVNNNWPIPDHTRVRKATNGINYPLNFTTNLKIIM